MRPLSKYLFAPVFFLVLLMPSFAQAQIVTDFGPLIPDECRCRDQSVTGSDMRVSTAPDYGCVLQVVQNVVNLAINLGIVFFVIALSYAGFLLIVSMSNPGRRGKAKKLVLNVFIGLVIMLTSWLIVDFVMKELAGDDTGGFGPWNSILADNGENRCLKAATPRAITEGELTLQQQAAQQGGGGAVAGGNDGPAVPIEGWRLSAAAQRQVGDAAAPLTRALACIRGRVPDSVRSKFTIESITGSTVSNGQATVQQCKTRQSCVHQVYSCHYGGRDCPAQSYAADLYDFRRASNAEITAVANAAQACGADTYHRLNDRHHKDSVHVSVGRRYNCFCGSGGTTH